MGTPARDVDADADNDLEQALLAYAHRKAARWGAERFAEEFRRRDEAEAKDRRPVWTSDPPSPPVEASVEAQVVEGEPTGFRPEPQRTGFDPAFVVAPEGPRGVAPSAGAEDAREPEPVAREPEPLVPEPEPLVPEPEPETRSVDIAELEVAFEAEAITDEPEPVALPTFASDSAWSAGAGPSGVRGRLPAALRHPYVPRPPAPEPTPAVEPKRRWRAKRSPSEPPHTPAITASEWARMSPGARRLYGLEDQPEERRAG